MYGSDDTQVSPAHKPSNRAEPRAARGAPSSSLLLTAGHGREAEGSCGWRVCTSVLEEAALLTEPGRESKQKQGGRGCVGPSSLWAYTLGSSLLVQGKSLHSVSLSFLRGKMGLSSLILHTIRSVYNQWVRQAASRPIREHPPIPGALLTLGIRDQPPKVSLPCSHLPSAIQGAHRLFLLQLFIFRPEFDFNHYLADSISSPWMKGPRREEGRSAPCWV